MSDLATLIKSINSQITSLKTSFVYYNKENGKIYKISNRKLDDAEKDFVEVPHEQVKSILEGKQKLEEFYITYDLSAKSLIVKEHNYEDNLDTINYKLHELPIITKLDDKISLESVYEGLEIYLWLPNINYDKGSLIWYNNNVYKVINLLNAASDINFDKIELYIENVYLLDSNLSTQLKKYKQEFNPIFKEIFVDVWYKELPHVSGQHVWYKNAVYKFIKDAKEKTEFDIKNVELILNDVKLYNDTNQNLDFFKELFPGMKVLDNNRLYMIEQIVDESKETFTSDINFYATSNLLVTYKLGEIYIKENNKVDFELPFKQEAELRKGDIILIEKSLFLVDPEKREFDISIKQDHILKNWSINIHKKTKKSLIESKYIANDILYFSITAKNDPNILYRVIKCNLKDLLQEKIDLIPFEYDWEFNKEEVSVYTPKYFKNYIQEVIQ